MKALIRGMRGEFLKMRHTFLPLLHIGVPVSGCAVFLLYYRFSDWDEMNRISGYTQVIGVALPFLVSIVCAGNIRLEEQNHFQVLLGGWKEKWKGLTVKYLVLAGMELLTITGALALFGAGSWLLLPAFGEGKSFAAGMYLLLVAALFLGSLPLYLEHLFLNLAFSGTVSQCVGVAQFLLSALFLTGLGEGRWRFFPCTWSARGAMLALSGIYQENPGDVYFAELRQTVFICLLLLAVICVIIGLWYHYFEGRQCND